MCERPRCAVPRSRPRRTGARCVGPRRWTRGRPAQRWPLERRRRGVGTGVRMRTVGVEDLARAVEETERPGPGQDEGGRRLRVVASGNGAVLLTTLAVVDRALPRYRLNALNAPPGIPDREGVVRDLLRRGRHAAVARAGLRPEPAVDGAGALQRPLPPTSVVLHTTPPRAGRCRSASRSTCCRRRSRAAGRGGLVVAQVNPRMPYTYGDAELPSTRSTSRSRSTSRCRSHAPRPGRRRPPDRGARRQPGQRRRHPPDGHRRGARRRPRGPDRPPWAAGVDRDVQRRGARLDRAGALDGSHPLTASFLFGCAELYAWVDGNDRGADDAHRDHQRPRPIASSGDDLHQHRAAGRPVRAGRTPRGSAPASTPASAARPTSSWGRCTRRAGRRSSRCAPGTPRPTCRRSCRWSTSRSRPSSRQQSSPSMAWPRSGATTSVTRPRAHRAAAHPRVREELCEEAQYLGLA